MWVGGGEVGGWRLEVSVSGRDVCFFSFFCWKGEIRAAPVSPLREQRERFQKGLGKWTCSFSGTFFWGWKLERKHIFGVRFISSDTRTRLFVYNQTIEQSTLVNQVAPFLIRFGLFGDLNT